MPYKYELTVAPESEADIPDGDGYHLSTNLRDNATDTPNSLAVSMLMDGQFSAGNKPHTKHVFTDDSYRLRVSITNDNDRDALDAMLSPYVAGDDGIPLGGTTFAVEDSTTEAATMQDLAETARSHATGTPEVSITYNTPTCVVHPHSTVTEMFPHRRSVFPTLAGDLNAALEANDELGDLSKVALDPFDVGTQLFEKPNANSYRTYSTLTDMRDTGEGEEPFFRQGYVGDCTYSFRNADSDVIEDVLLLSQFAEYNGVGTDTDHGCGCVTTTINNGDR